MQFQEEIVSEPAWKHVIYETPKQVAIVEVYQRWCGKTKCIVAPLRRIYFELEEVPIKFFTVCADTIGELSEYIGDCKPQFIFFQDGKRIKEIDGVDLHLITEQINDIAKEFGATRSEPPPKNPTRQKSLPSVGRLDDPLAAED